MKNVITYFNCLITRLIILGGRSIVYITDIVVLEREKFNWPTTWSWTGGELISLKGVLAKAWYRPSSFSDTLRKRRLPLSDTDSLGLWDEEVIFAAFLYQVTLPTDTWLSIVTSAPV